jgi:YgiT-type zinc finger domain-containing protein
MPKDTKVEETTPSLPEPFPCTECASGLMHMRFITYFTWLNEELLTVPNFPAWVCDVCGRREYDEKAISWLTMLLNPNAGRPTARRRFPAHPRPRSDSPRTRPNQT